MERHVRAKILAIMTPCNTCWRAPTVLIIR